MSKGGPALDIILEGITKAFGNHAVLKDCTMRFPEGRVSCIMAPSGAGKTTLLRILMGLEKPDSGRVDGLTGRRMSAVFQEDRLLPWGSTAGNIRFVNAKLTPEEIESGLEEVGLGGTGRVLASELSGGMARRVALVRALLSEWDVLFLDEPFKGLDADAKHLAIEAVRAHRKGRTVILVTHDQSEVEALDAVIFHLPLLPYEEERNG